MRSPAVTCISGNRLASKTANDMPDDSRHFERPAGAYRPLSAPEARDSAPPLPGTDVPADWDAPVPATGAHVFSGLADPLAQGFRGTDQLYGYARHIVETTFLATSGGLRRRYTQPTGSVEINAKRHGASAWVGVGTPDFVDVPTDSMLEELSTRLGWAQRTVELPAGRYETLMPPSTPTFCADTATYA